MRRQSPSLAPDFNSDTYLVVDELQTGYSVYREADEVEATRGEVIRQITEGQFNKAVCVIAFNVAEGWSRDATEDIAKDILDHALRKAEQLSRPAREFVERVLKEDVPAGISAGY